MQSISSGNLIVAWVVMHMIQISTVNLPYKAGYFMYTYMCSVTLTLCIIIQCLSFLKGLHQMYNQIIYHIMRIPIE